ncbi:MAG: DUF4363 family protein [Clostridia bacterium]
MVKNVITLILSIIILISAGIWQIDYLNKTSMYAMSDTEYIKNLIQNDNFKLANEHIKELENTWNGMKDTWNIFVTHDEIDDVEEAMTNFKMYTLQENKEEALVYAQQIHQNLNHIAKNQQVRFENIF